MYTDYFTICIAETLTIHILGVKKGFKILRAIVLIERSEKCLSNIGSKVNPFGVRSTFIIYECSIS